MRALFLWASIAVESGAVMSMKELREQIGTAEWWWVLSVFILCLPIIAMALYMEDKK